MKSEQKFLFSWSLWCVKIFLLRVGATAVIYFRAIIHYKRLINLRWSQKFALISDDFGWNRSLNFKFYLLRQQMHNETTLFSLKNFCISNARVRQQFLEWLHFCKIGARTKSRSLKKTKKSGYTQRFEKYVSIRKVWQENLTNGHRHVSPLFIQKF